MPASPAERARLYRERKKANQPTATLAERVATLEMKVAELQYGREALQGKPISAFPTTLDACLSAYGSVSAEKATPKREKLTKPIAELTIDDLV